MKTLLDLLKQVDHKPQGDLGVPIANVAYDSRRVTPGTLFVAIRGTHTDGHAYIQQALASGAVAVIYDDSAQAPPAGVPAAQVADAKVALSPIAAAFYDYPAHQLEVVGITGSKGKTTTTFLTAAALEASGEQVGFLSTVDFKIGDLRSRWRSRQCCARWSTPAATTPWSKAPRTACPGAGIGWATAPTISR
jgi:UDP-N-acetylmuramoyl-L-alanyl-D-glutamate--2,6-diaminopimelate ligase